MHDGKVFCCNGCKSVYTILNGKRLYKYYDFNQHPGITPAIQRNEKFDYLDDPDVSTSLIDFSDGDYKVINFIIPQMHCSSCIWLLENLHDLHPGVISSRADFLKKSISVRYNGNKITLRQIVELLASIGYEPEITAGDKNENRRIRNERNLYLKVGVAAFCFGNIMLFSLPEYLSSSTIDVQTRNLFGYINLVLSLPVIGYSSLIYFDSAIKSLSKKIINVDLPIAFGILIVFIRSAAEVIFGMGPGYFDSLTGLVFFLLLGRLFQNKTYDTLNFERKYHSYFPLAVSVLRDRIETSIPITLIRPGERMLLRNNEIIPADSVLISESASIDYSFVTGESKSTYKKSGDTIYAGGKNQGNAVELEALKEVSESEFVQLWNEFGPEDRNKSQLLSLSNTIGKYFTIGILLVALVTAIYWWFSDPTNILNAITAVLIVACPCALALAAPFTFGTTLRIFGKRGFYLKQSSVVEALSKMDTIVFDKTGTITETKLASINYNGKPLSDLQKSQIASLVRGSTHPLSRSIYNFLATKEILKVTDFSEVESAGIAGEINGEIIKLGSEDFVGVASNRGKMEGVKTVVYLAIDEKLMGQFEFNNLYRKGLSEVLKNLGLNHDLIIQSGDSDGEKNKLEIIYPDFKDMVFNQKPAQKLEYIKSLQTMKKHVIMIGDGINDSGALWQSDVAIAITEDVSTFSPSCDAILKASCFNDLDKFIRFATTAKVVVYLSFVISIIYNIVGLYFAVRAELSPILAAILMPLSSITVVLFATLLTRLLARNKELI